MKRYVIGNWKMKGTKEHVFAFMRTFQKAYPTFNQTELEIVLCPPALYLAQAATILQGQDPLPLGAQDVSAYLEGAYTGQLSAHMLQEHGCRYVLVGHSERRHYCQESAEEVIEKGRAAQAAGIIPVVCVGETQAQRREGQTDNVLRHQLAPLFKGAPLSFFLLAYEPVWAIGTGQAALPSEVAVTHRLIKSILSEYDAQVAQKVPILYGGSVNQENVQALMALPEVQGVLVGGASLNVAVFVEICKLAN